MARPKKDRGQESKHHRAVDPKVLTKEQKARIAEAAVLHRLALHGYEVYGQTFDGQKVDWIVQVGRRLIRIQVKWAGRVSKHGLPVVRLRCADGRGKFRRYASDEVDFVVGYDLYTDTAYVFPFAEVRENNYVTIRPDAAEQWHRLKE